MKVDRRIQKTRDALRDALADLMSEKPYEDITVYELTHRANVSRSSFYVHFQDKDDLLISGFQEIGVNSSDDLFEMRPDGSPYPDFSSVLFRGTERWKDAARACWCSETSNAATAHLRNMLVIQTREWLKSIRPPLSPADLESTVHYLSSALQGLLTWWVKNDFPYPAEVVSEHFNRLAVSGLQSILPSQDSTDD